MPRTPVFEWHGKQYAFEEKNADWYWALGIVAAAAIIASVLFNNYLLALVILAAAITIGLQAAKRPRIHHFAVTDDGVEIDEHLYPYERMIDFSVLEYADESLPPALSLHTSHLLAPHILIPILDHDPLEVYEYIARHLPEGRHDESLMHRLVDLLRL